jgi:sigma-B regulation protein RsbU (phosphoserine phosphatase)
MSEHSKLERLNEKLSQRDFKLNALLEVTRAINNNYSVEKLLDIYKYIIKEQLEITKLILLTYDQYEWNIFLKYGHKGALKNISVDKDLGKIKDITVIESSSKNYLDSFDVVVPVFHKDMPLAYLLIGDLNENAEGMSPTIKHMNFIQTLTNIIVVAIENKRLAKENIRQEVVKKELQLAAEMQSLLLPGNLPVNKDVEMAAKYVAHHSVGGDYYDFIELNHTEFVFCVADVSGKGISAALLMSNFQANLRAIIKYTDFSLPKLIEELNTSVINSAKGERFITLFIARYNIITRKLKYINAGHNHPILTNGKEVRFLSAGCTGIGMLDQIPHIEEDEVFVAPNSLLVSYTDGLVEVENEHNDPFSLENLTSVIHRNFSMPMRELNEKLFKAVEEHKGENPFMDDTAILSLRIC